MAKPPAMSEADLCTGFITLATKDGRWTAYPETAGFDILLVRAADGVQIGIEAKLRLNPLVVSQALPERTGWASAHTGPDYRAVLVPAGGTPNGLHSICAALGITVLSLIPPDYPNGPAIFVPDLPREASYPAPSDRWHEWAPAKRCPLPDYIPDCPAGTSAPLALTAWKVKAIKLAILLEERPVSRADFKHLDLSPSRWTDPYSGWLARTHRGYVPTEAMPDFKLQHPRNYAEIAADKASWAPPTPMLLAPPVEQGALI